MPASHVIVLREARSLVSYTAASSPKFGSLLMLSALDSQDKILREVRIAAGRLGRLTLWGADMWIKDQYVDIFCRWVYLPLYAILAAISLNEST